MASSNGNNGGVLDKDNARVEAVQVPQAQGLSGNTGNNGETTVTIPAPSSVPLPSSTIPGDPPRQAISRWSRALSIVLWTPPRCRYDPDHPPSFGLGLNLVYAVASCFTVANLYWNQPVLNKIADTFDVSHERASTVATLMQSGYAGGLLFLCPMGDMVPRRPFIIAIILATNVMWIGLCITPSFPVFQALSFLCGLTTVTPQLMLPLVGDMAPPRRRASSLSVVVSGLMLGMLVARLLSGIVANYTHWRNVYWFALGAQVVVAALLYFMMPDYPATNKAGQLHYGAVQLDIVRLLLWQPTLAQACVVAFCASALFTSFWTTLTFLLSGDPYNYDPLAIGLFALIGIAAIAGGPVYGRLLTDRLVPWYSAVLGMSLAMTGTAVSVGISPLTVAGPIVQALGLDIGLQLVQVSNRTAIFGIDPTARNRINTAYMLLSFCGQLTGTAVGNRLYASGGWQSSAGSGVGFACLALVTLLVKGPQAKGWFGWDGSWRVRVDHEVEEKEGVGSQVAGSGQAAESASAVTDKNARPVEEGRAPAGV